MAKKKTIQPKLRFKNEEGNDYPDWEEKALEDVAEIVGGGTPDTSKTQFWGGEIQWFTPTELKKKYVSRSSRTITEEGLKASSAKLLPKGTLLLSTRATVGDISIASQQCTTNQGFQSLIVKEGNFNEFVYYWLLNNKKVLLEKAKGSTFLEIGKTEVRKILIEMPSLEEQKKIAEFLSAIDTKIENLEKELEELKAYKKGVMQALFAAASDATERRLKIEALQGTKKHGFFIRFKEENGNDYPDWAEKTLGELMTFKNGINAEKHQYGKGVKFINVLDIINNSFITYDKIIGSVEVSEKELQVNEVNYGDILFQRSSETREEVGQATVYLDEKAATFGGFVIRGKAIAEYDPAFMNFLLKTSKARKEITDKSGGSTRYNIGQETLKEVKVFLPCMEEQKKISNFLTAIDEKIEYSSNQIQNTRQYKQALLQQLFN